MQVHGIGILTVGIALLWARKSGERDALLKSKDDVAIASRKSLRSGGFGLSIRKEFVLDFTLTNLNHGSYGACPRVVLNKFFDETMRLESFPDCRCFVRRRACQC